MMEEKGLNDTLRAIILEHGIERVERALAQIRKSAVVRKDRDVHSPDRTLQTPRSSADQRRRTKTTAPVYVSKLDVDSQVRARLEEAARQYESKLFLPTIGEIRNFCSIHGIELLASPSRVAAIPRIFKHLSQLTPQEIHSILQSSAFSGPTRLAPIADAIRRSSGQRAAEGTADRGAHRSLLDTTETKEKDVSKPPIPKRI